MSKSNHEEDLDLLLSLQDRVLETPPGSPPSSYSPGYLSDDGSPKRRGQADMSVFRDAVQDCLDYDHETAKKALKAKSNKSSKDTTEVEKFSGLKIRNQVVSSVELSNRLSDIRFVRLPAIKNLLNGDTLSGCWATIGVLTERGNQRTSSTGKAFAIWKMGCLNEKTVSVFLFGDAYKRNCNEKTGTVFALFNSGVRKDSSENGFCLSVFSAGNILKIGDSMDYGLCKGKRKDGTACTLVINKRRGIYCSYHRQETSQKYSVKRAELKGGNLRTAFREPPKPEGIYMVDRSSNKLNPVKSSAPLKLLSVEALKKALSNAGQTTTNIYSQGIRFLTEVTGKSGEKESVKHCEKRLSSSLQKDLQKERSYKEPDTKKIKVDGPALGEKNNHVGTKMIELEFISSDEE
ncbi:hypothetical protein M9H77_33837 [Catharanthus roseus]|uniref:Uncharacterized protein n=1 Tax=Catharanthus roseus TaxID=4058 RepID=A0ACB9ZLM9_CATRO|nr:hypothetical protein M9H77_33837 [Catharanthus roseus]